MSFPFHRTARPGAAALATLLCSSIVAAAPAARRPAAVPIPESYRLCVEERREPGVAACRGALGLGLGLGPARTQLAQRALALHLAELERWDEVVETYRDQALQRPSDPEAQFRAGAALVYLVRRPEEALGHLQAAAALRAADPAIHAALGVALNALGRHAEAVAALEEALRLDPAYLERRPAARLVLEASRRGEAWP